MWKKQDDGTGSPLEFGSQQSSEFTAESADEELDELMEKAGVGPRRVLAEVSQPPKAATMAAYTEAVNEVTKNATAFIEHLPLLTKARDAYDRAMKAGAEMRRVLDTDEEHLRALMTQLAQVLNDHMVKPASEKKRPELAKLEAIRGTELGTGESKRFP